MLSGTLLSFTHLRSHSQHIKKCSPPTQKKERTNQHVNRLRITWSTSCKRNHACKMATLFILCACYARYLSVPDRPCVCK
jgi:hypothetical protein